MPVRVISVQKNLLAQNQPSLIFALPIKVGNRIDPWCNGNTTDFGSVIYGSNPYGSTKAGIYQPFLFYITFVNISLLPETGVRIFNQSIFAN